MRVSFSGTPFPHHPEPAFFGNVGTWPCCWVGLRHAGDPPFVAAYRLRFEMLNPEVIRIHVSADERYELFLDGARIGRGPERGDIQHWFYETYDLDLSRGEHVLVARVSCLGEAAPCAQFSGVHGFLLCTQEERFWDLLGTGRAPWEALKLDGYSFIPTMAIMFCGHRHSLDCRQFNWGYERGEGQGWLPVVHLHSGNDGIRRNHTLPNEQLLLPAPLPPMMEQPRHIGRVRHVSAPALSETHSIPIRTADHLRGEETGWQELLSGQAPLTLPANSRRRVIIDLENYYCAYPEMIVSGGENALLRMHWQEALFSDPQKWDRGERGDVEGKYFTTMWHHRDGEGNLYHLDGGNQRRLDSLWWQAGRYVELLVETSNQPLTIQSLIFIETRFPLEMESHFEADDPRLEEVIPIAVRGLQMCAHETYMDCPYYEQLQYAGDTRLECLVTYAISRDDRLPRKALHMFDVSRLPEGFTQSRYPSRIRQMIPPFSLWWVSMVHDYLFWRGDFDFVRSLMPGVRAVLDAFTALRRADGLVQSPPGWNYIDWVTAWQDGIPPGGEMGQVCGPLNWQYVYALARAAEVEAELGEMELAGRWRKLAQQAVASLTRHFWDAGRGLYADDFDHRIFSEHSQCLAVLSRNIPAGQRAAIAHSLFDVGDLTRPTVYFMHYFFETCRELKRMDILMERMAFWFEMKRMDFKTTYENGDPHTNRSDCHGWGAHPLYHYFASILGIRPDGPSFNSVEVMPQLGGLHKASGVMVHPRGEIRCSFEKSGQRISGFVELPQGVSGWLRANGKNIEIDQKIEF